jgi:translocator protein
MKKIKNFKKKSQIKKINNTKNNIIFSILWGIIICELAGLIGSIFTFRAIPGWYHGLNKPNFNPPNWIFGPVWTILYILMGIALAYGWKNKVNLTWFWTQLGLNALWSIIFFGWHRTDLAFIEIVLMWYMIILTIRSFAQKNVWQGWLLTPYLFWVSFASLLNWFIWKLN